MRWNNLLGNPDELSEVVQFLGFENPGELIAMYLAEGRDITQFARYVDNILIQKQQTAAAALTLEEAEFNGIPLFHFKEWTLDTITRDIIGLINGHTVENSKQLAESRAPRRTLKGFMLNGDYFDVGSFSEMLLLTVKQLLLLPDAVAKLDSVNGAIATDKTQLNPNGKIIPVHHADGTPIYVDVKRSADQLEDLAMKCAKALGQSFEVVP